MIDLVVVGGGPVGLATALYADRAGMSVVVLERRAGDIDKACGEGLMPGAVRALRDLGVEPEGRAFRGIRYTDGVRSVAADFRSDVGIGVRRTTLHHQLRELVDKAGISVEEVSVEAFEAGADRIVAGGVSARYLAGADGLHSTVRRLAGLEIETRASTRFGLRRHFEMAPWTDYVEVHWARRSEAYVTPVADNLVGVAILTSERGDFESQLRRFPWLAAQLGSAVPGVRGAGPLRQRTRARTSGRTLLVGDAAGYVDALTGEGIAVGLAAARALVTAVLRDDPASYERSWRSSTRQYRQLTGALLWTRQRSVVGPRIVAAANTFPRVFGLAVNQLAK